jgi:hypothetical protein
LKLEYRLIVTENLKHRRKVRLRRTMKEEAWRICIKKNVISCTLHGISLLLATRVKAVKHVAIMDL